MTSASGQLSISCQSTCHVAGFVHVQTQSGSIGLRGNAEVTTGTEYCTHNSLANTAPWRVADGD